MLDHDQRFKLLLQEFFADFLQLFFPAQAELMKSNENQWRKFLLGDCLVTYAATDEAHKQELRKLLEREEYREVSSMVTTWYDEGVQEGQRRLIRALLQDRFEANSLGAYARVDSLPAEQLEELAKAIGKAKSLQELGLE
jgi:hypothetical protein